MEVHDVELTISAVAPKQYPKGSLPEVALAGRSNVGKSSLINTLINRKAYARTSSQPGKTQTLNFYNVESTVYFVDVPGYGFAKVSKTAREKFGQMIETYLSTRDRLRGVILLVDARHDPSDDDISMHEWLSYYNIPMLVVATKSDKIARGKWNQAESRIRKGLNMTPEDAYIQFSAETKQGKDAVWNWIEQQAGLA
ncbi:MULTISPECIES: ribosome biogenesis GTP-binding protein YihA/YsxC [Furfurilactobacillus]|uniref:Probable GTP-binding protein EngB n=1 Tax=Furfurilactobacillus rossiae TaxID=231049 RepID=A0A7C9IRJ8_9LACO|nr:ribosome biogenesis GTP-binding protein YihA/YsxC [Furfurilactobacillus milii]MYV04899.1 YihA family ribosome biogenesis GTP-binding protein [Furfurilactobacillus milii]